MPLSTYSRAFSPAAFPGSALLFSTRTAAALLVPEAMLGEIERETLSGEERRTLSEQGFLVADRGAEQAGMLSFLDELAALDRSLRPLVVLNLDCNFDCVYCFEGTRRGRHHLSPETAERLLAYLGGGALAGAEELAPTFYGGEPLLSLERLCSLAAGMQALARERGIPFRFSLVTNGSLLDRERVERLLPLGLEAASVTLDGPRETHDAARPFRGGRGSYDLILANLGEVADLVELRIGGNYTEGNHRFFPRLLDDLAAAGLGPGRVAEVRFDPVFRESAGIAPPDFHEGCVSQNEPWLIEAGVFLRGEILRRGYRTGRVMPSRCMVDAPGRPVVNWDGVVYPCPGFIGRPKFRIGDLSGELPGRATGAAQGPPPPTWRNDTCLACAYLPLCLGGCRYFSLLRGDDPGTPDCRKPYFDAVLERLVLQDIAQRPTA